MQKTMNFDKTVLNIKNKIKLLEVTYFMIKYCASCELTSYTYLDKNFNGQIVSQMWICNVNLFQ